MSFCFIHPQFKSCRGLRVWFYFCFDTLGGKFTLLCPEVRGQCQPQYSIPGAGKVSVYCSRASDIRWLEWNLSCVYKYTIWTNISSVQFLANSIPEIDVLYCFVVTGSSSVCWHLSNCAFGTVLPQILVKKVLFLYNMQHRIYIKSYHFEIFDGKMPSSLVARAG